MPERISRSNLLNGYKKDKSFQISKEESLPESVRSIEDGSVKWNCKKKIGQKFIIVLEATFLTKLLEM